MRHSLLIVALVPVLWLAGPPSPGSARGQDEASVLERLAEERFAEDDLPGAAAFYIQASRASTAVRDQARLLVNAAWLAHLLGSGTEAVSHLEEALSLDPDFPFDPALYRNDFVRLYDEAASRNSARRDRDHNRRISDAIQAIDEGDLSRARALLERAAHERPDDPTAIYNMALLDMREDRIEEARAGFERVAELAESASAAAFVPPTLHARAKNQLGILLLRHEAWSQAITTLEQAVEIDPQNGSAWNNLGLAQHRLGRFGSAASSFEKAIARSGEQATLIRNLGLALVEGGFNDRAHELLVPASERFPRDPQIWLALGRSRLGKGQPEVAVGDFERALRHGEGDAGLAAEAWAQLAQARYEAGSPTEAVAAAGEALAMRPDNPHSWLYLGIAQRQLGRVDEAASSFERAVELAPDRTDILNNLGDAYFNGGRYEEAVAAFEKAVRLRPDLELAKANLDVARSKISEQEAAAAKASESAAQGKRAPPTKHAQVASEVGGATLASRANGRAKRPVASSSGSKKPAKRGATSPPEAVLHHRELGLELEDAKDETTGLSAARVIAVGAESDAASSGLRVGDLILRVDGRPITLAGQLAQELGRQPIGSTTRLDLLRGSEPVRVELQRSASTR